VVFVVHAAFADLCEEDGCQGWPGVDMKAWTIIITLLAVPSARASGLAEETVGSSRPPSEPSRAAAQGLVSDQFSVGATPGSTSSPRAGFVADRLLGSNDLTSSIGLLYGVAVTRDLGSPPAAGTRFADRGGTIARFSAGTEWQASSHWALIPMISASPPSTIRTSTTIPFQDATGASTNLAGDLQVRSSSLGAELSAELDLLDLWGPELVVTSTAGFVNYWSTQRLLKLQLANDSVVTPAALARQCQSQGCSAEVEALLAKPSPSVLQTYAELDVTMTVRRTEVGATGTGFVYSRDPTQLGFFGIAAFARGPSIGDGVALAPLRFSTQGHVAQKIGRLRLAGTGEYGRYVDSEGSTVRMSAKPAYDVTSRVRLWVTGTWQRDDLTTTGPLVTLIAAMGLRWSY
jgi:hypothetical protein